ncbi:MAG: HAD family hydrolase, partial [bacterium]
GDTPVVITATNSFVTAPIVAAFGIEHLIATTPEKIDGEFTGQVDGVPCFQEGKVLRLQQWLEGRDMSLDGSWFYSDSHNDMPLLERVTTSVAVDPDKKLDHVARQRGWRIESFR